MTAHPGWGDPGHVSGAERRSRVTPPPGTLTVGSDVDTPPGTDVYLISIRGSLGPSLSASFAPMIAHTANGCTELRGFVQDQAALYGILARIQSLGLQLDEVIRLSNTPRRHSE